MSTITISLPEQIAQKIDIEAESKGFATRSEFIRSLVRKHFSSASEEITLEPFVHKPLHKIRAEFEKTGKYNKKFIDSVIKGLSESSVYANKTTK